MHQINSVSVCHSPFFTEIFYIPVYDSPCPDRSFCFFDDDDCGPMNSSVSFSFDRVCLCHLSYLRFRKLYTSIVALIPFSISVSALSCKMSLFVTDVAFITKYIIKYLRRSSSLRSPFPNYTFNYLPLNYFPLILHYIILTCSWQFRLLKDCQIR